MSYNQENRMYYPLFNPYIGYYPYYNDTFYNYDDKNNIEYLDECSCECPCICECATLGDCEGKLCIKCINNGRIYFRRNSVQIPDGGTGTYILRKLKKNENPRKNILYGWFKINDDKPSFYNKKYMNNFLVFFDKKKKFYVNEPGVYILERTTDNNIIWQKK